MQKCFLSFDLLGPRPKIYYRGNERYKTWVGVIFTFLCLGLILGFIVYFFISFVKGDEMYIQSTITKTLPNFSIDLSNKQIRYKLVDSSNKEIDPKIINVFPLLFTQTNTTLYKKQLNTSKCDVFDLLDNSNNNSNLYNYSCLSKDSSNKLQINNYNNTYLTLFVAKCLNSTKNNRHCLPLEDIDIFLIRNKIYLIIFLENNSINHSESHPFTSSYIYKRIEIETSLYYKYYYTFKQAIYTIDKGIVFTKEDKYNSYLFEDYYNLKINLPNYDAEVPNSFMEISFVLNSQSAVDIKRTYVKFQRFLSESGGVIVLISKLGEYIILMITQGKMYTQIISQAKSLSIVGRGSPSSSNSNIMSNNSAIQEAGNFTKNDLAGKSNPNNSISLNNSSSFNLSNFTKFTKYKKKERILQKEGINGPNKKTINLCHSFCYALSCKTGNSNKKKYINICEEIVKQKLSCEELMQKLKDLEYSITNIVPNNSNNTSTILIEHKDNNESSIFGNINAGIEEIKLNESKQV